MHVLTQKPELTLALIESMKLLKNRNNCSETALVDELYKAYTETDDSLFFMSHGSTAPTEISAFERTYYFTLIGYKEYLDDVFYGSYQVDFSPSGIIAWMGDVLGLMDIDEVGSLTQVGFLRTYSETHPSKSFAECEEYHEKYLPKIFGGYQTAKTQLDQLNARVDSNEGFSIENIEKLVTILNKQD